MTYPFIGDALALATLAHQGQLYGLAGETPVPYIEHPIAVARIILDATGDPELAAAALLHDTVEDTFVTLAMIQRHGFTRRIIMAVAGVTRAPTGETYEAFVERAALNEDSRRIKMADNMANRATLPNTDRRYGRYARAWQTLVRANGGVDLHGRAVELPS
jgi:(p)ppGpp synthase/HD superfamily hydrolase